jgi:hypothetical protein
MAKEIPKRDLFTTFEHIERYHQRRSVFVFHTILSLAFQVAIWVNWYFSYVIRGYGLEVEFFMPRLIVSLVLLIFLVGHFVLIRIAESKDRTVMELLRRQEEDEADSDSLTDEDDELEPEYAAGVTRTKRGSG